MTATIETRDGVDYVVDSDDWVRQASLVESELWAHKDTRIAELEKALRDIRAFLVQVNKGMEMGGIDSQIVAAIDLALMVT